MIIEANAIERLKQYFYYINWKDQKGKTAQEIPEDALANLFLQLGLPADDTIRLVKYQEYEIAPNYDVPGSLFIALELAGNDDFITFTCNYFRDIMAYEESMDTELNFNNLRKYKTFLYNTETHKWSLYGYKR